MAPFPIITSLPSSPFLSPLPLEGITPSNASESDGADGEASQFAPEAIATAEGHIGAVDQDARSTTSTKSVEKCNQPNQNSMPVSRNITQREVRMNSEAIDANEVATGVNYSANKNITIIGGCILENNLQKKEKLQSQETTEEDTKSQARKQDHQLQKLTGRNHCRASVVPTSLSTSAMTARALNISIPSTTTETLLQLSRIDSSSWRPPDPLSTEDDHIPVTPSSSAQGALPTGGALTAR